MKRKICKMRTVKITNDIIASYQLISEDGKYSIVCIENNRRTNQIHIEKSFEFAKCERSAIRMYNLIVKNKACEGTINDIIRDQMC